jgi:hypothetical protein
LIEGNPKETIKYAMFSCITEGNRNTRVMMKAGGKVRRRTGIPAGAQRVSDWIYCEEKGLVIAWGFLFNV